MINYLNQNDPARLKYLNIFLTSGSGFAHATRGEYFSQSYNLFINMRGMYGAPGGDWAGSILMAHEMCHVLDLCHTYLGGGCASTLNAMGTNPEDGDYFDDIFGTPYPGNAPHLAPSDPPTHPWSYDVTISTTDKVTNNLLGGYQASHNLSPLQIGKAHRALALKTARRYLVNCIYDSNNPWTISGNEDWDFDIQWDKDIKIQTGSTMNILCKLSMPQTSSITVESGGVLNVDGIVTNNCDNGWNGTIHIKPGGVLNLKTNAEITFIGNGKIIIDDDAINPGLLSIEGVPNVYLNGINTMIDIRGKIELKDNSTFTFSSTTSNHGYLLFSNTSLSPSRNITAGNNTSIIINGNSQNSRSLKITQEGFYAPPNLSMLLIENCKVELASDSRLLSDGLNTSIILDGVKFTSTTPGTNNGHRGVHLFGQPLVIIDNCVFEYGYNGIFADLTNGSSSLGILNSVFRENTIGVQAFNKGLNFGNCYFYNNDYGVYGSYMNWNSESFNSIFSGNGTGFYWHGYSTPVFTFDNPSINQSNIGAYVRSAPLNIICGSVSYNGTGLKIRDGGTLRMDDNFPSNPPYANVTAINNDITIEAGRANYLYLNNGNNDLSPSGINNYSAVNGTILSGPDPLPAASNKWNVSGNFSTDDYLLYGPGGQMTIDDPNVLSSITACGQAIPPCADPPCEEYPDALKECPTCEIINTDNFENVSLDEATVLTLDVFNSSEENNYRYAINLFCEILLQEYAEPNNEELYLLNFNYLKLMESLGLAFSTEQILCSENATNLCQELSVIIEVQNKLIDLADLNGDYDRKFYYSLDKAQTYRIGCRLDLCSDFLYSMYDWTEGDDRIELDRFLCRVNLESQIVDKSIDFGTIQELQSDCDGTLSLRKSNHIKSSQTDFLETNISIFPNPAFNYCDIKTNIESVNLNLFDAFGRNVYSQKMSFETQLDLSMFSKGIYYLSLEDNATKIIYNKKVVIQ